MGCGTPPSCTAITEAHGSSHPTGNRHQPHADCHINIPLTLLTHILQVGISKNLELRGSVTINGVAVTGLCVCMCVCLLGGVVLEGRGKYV